MVKYKKWVPYYDYKKNKWKKKKKRRHGKWYHITHLLDKL